MSKELGRNITNDEVVSEKPYTLRSLKNRDLWSIVRILGKLLPEDMKKAFVQVTSGEKTVKDLGYMVGADMAIMIIQNAYKAQAEVDLFCADMAGISVNELNDMEFGTTPMIIMDIFNDAKNVSFFKVLSKFFS